MSFISELSKPLERSPFYCRPLALMSAVFLCALFTVQLSTAASAVFAVLIVSFSIFIIFKHGIRSPLTYLMIIFLLMGQILSLSEEACYRRVCVYDGSEAEIKVVITEKIYREAFGAAWNCEILTINGEKYTGCAVLNVTDAPEFQIYDTVLLRASVSDARSGISGSELLRLKSERTYLELDCEEIKSVTNENKRGPEYLIYKIRTKIGNRLDSSLPSGSAAFAKALLTGERSGLGADFRRDMSAIGISHILAVSGMHTSVIASAVAAICERTNTGRRRKSIIISAAAIAFMAVAGFSPSVVRASVMLVLSVVPVFFGRKGDSITALFVSGLLICLFSPETILSCSFLLSFFASLSLVTVASYVTSRTYTGLHSSRAGDMKRGFALLRKLLLSVTASLCASLITIPVLSLYFSETSFVAVLTNLVAVPCATIAVVLALFVLIFSGIPGLSWLTSFLFDAVYGFLSGFASVISDSFKTSVSLSYPFFVPILILLFTVFLFLRMRGIRSPAALIAPFIACVLIFAAGVQIYGAANADRNEAVYFADKSSEGFLLCTGNKTLYIDIGRGGKSLPALGLEKAKTSYCETSVDAFMLTHYHADHISTLKKLVPLYRIETVYLPYPETDSDFSVLESIEKSVSGCSFVMYTRGDEIRFGDITLETQPYSLLERSTHPVISLGIVFEGVRLFYAGESLSESDAAFFAEGRISISDAVISGHHGPVHKEEIKYYSTASGCPVFVSPYAGGASGTLFPGADIRYLEAEDDGTVCLVFKGDAGDAVSSQASAHTALRSLFRDILPPEAAGWFPSYPEARLFRVHRASRSPAQV